MLRTFAAGFFLSLMLLLTACGGDGDGGAAAATAAPTPTGTASSNVVKGIVRNGVVRALRWQDGAYVEVARALTGSGGAFALAVPEPRPGEVLRLELRLASGADGHTDMLCDATQCGSATYGQWMPLTEELGLASWIRVEQDGRLTVMPLTPVSTLLVKYAESLGGGHLDAFSLEVGLLRVAALFRMDPADLLTRPGNIVDPLWLEAASPEAVKLSLLSAAFAELAHESGSSVEDVIAAYVAAFVENGGHLVQDGATQSLGDLYRTLDTLIATAGSPTVQAWVTDWMNNFLAALQSGELNTTACAPACAEFDSNAFVDALGLTPDTLGGDLRRVMQEKGVSKLEELLAGELAKYGWLASSDSVAVAAVAMQVLAFGAQASLGMPPQPANGLTPVLEGNVLHVTGTQATGTPGDDMQVDLSITLAPLFELIGGYDPNAPAPVFTYAVTGTVENSRMRASIDGSLAINSGDTDFRPLQYAMFSLFTAGDPEAQAAAMQMFNAAIAGILRTGQASFTIDGSAGLARLELQGDQLVETSRLAIAGQAQLKVDMNGRNDTAIKASGSVTHGSITLPNGDHFEVDPDQGHFLKFALGADGTFGTHFAANVLGYAAAVTGEGRLTDLGTLLTRARNSVARSMENGTDTTGMADALVAQVLKDFSKLSLNVKGSAEIPQLGHSYTLTIADGHLRISQPDSDVTALDLSLGAPGLLAAAGGKWWLLGADFSDLTHPALTLADSNGGEWRWEFDFSGLLVGPAPVPDYTTAL
jgi:hypothetical protein